MTAATHVINWKDSANITAPLTVKTEPEQIYVGESFRVKLFSAYTFGLISAYDGLGAKRIEASKPITETVQLSGTQNIRTEYPIKSISGIRAMLPLIDETTRTIAVKENQSALDQVEVVNQELKFKNSQSKLHGSIEIQYQTFDAQVWQHKSFAKKGGILLFAHNTELATYENVPLTINERNNTTTDTIKIEAWTGQQPRGFDPYHTVIIYPSKKKNLRVKTDKGRVQYVKTDRHTVKAEQIRFNGKEATTSYPCLAIESTTGMFFDINGNEIQPKFRLSDGVIKSDVDCYGLCFVDYQTEGRVYDYYAKIVNDDITHDNKVYIGFVFAFEKGQFDKAVSYQVPMWQDSTIQRVDFYKVMRKVVTQGKKTFEYPPNWDTDNSYPSNPSAATEDKPEVGVDYLATDIVAEAGHTDINGSIDYRTYPAFWYAPYFGSETNPDAVFEISVSIPSDIHDTDLIAKMNEAVDKAKERWGIA